MLRILSWAIGLIVLGVSASYLLLYIWPMHDPHPPQRWGQTTLAIRDAKIYPSPDEPAIEHATVVVKDGRIVAVGPDVTVPAEATLIPCKSCIVTAGFWNAHVHFTEPKWGFA